MSAFLLERLYFTINPRLPARVAGRKTRFSAGSASTADARRKEKPLIEEQEMRR
jgi:hypothetical protein